MFSVSGSLHAQDDQLEEARNLHEQSRDLFQRAKYLEGMSLAKRAFEIRELLLGGEHLDTAAALSNLASFYTANRINADIESLLKRTLMIYERKLGLEHPETATSLNQLANYYRANKPQEAEPLYMRALKIREKAFGAEHRDTSGVISNLGNLYLQVGKFRQAEPLHQRALSINEKIFGPEHPRTADSLNDLASTYGNLGLYSKQEPLLQRSLLIQEKIDAKHPRTALVLANLALLYEIRGDYTRSEPLFLRALSIREQALGPMHPEVASSLEYLANLYIITAAFDKAESLYRRSLAIWEASYGSESGQYGFALNYLGRVYALQSKFTQAEPLILQALAIERKALGNENPYVADTLVNLAELYGSIGSYAQAVKTFEQAIELHIKVFGPDHPWTSYPILGLANLYNKRQEYQMARTRYLEVLSVRERTLGTEHPLIADALERLAVLDWALGKTASALQLLQRAQHITALNVERFLFSSPESRNTAYLTSFLGNVSTYASFSAAVPGSKNATLGLNSVLQFKGRVADAAVDATSRLRRGLRPQDQASLKRLAEVANQLSTLMYQDMRNLSATTHRERIAELIREQDVLETVLARQSSDFANQTKQVTVATVRATLPPEAALVEWFRYEDANPHRPDGSLQSRYIAYILTSAANPIAIDLGAASELESLAREFRLATSFPERTDTKQRATALSNRLIAPLQPYLRGVKHLLLAPDGALNLVPMAALVDAQGSYLAERFEITYLTSGRDLLRIAARGPALNSNPVVIADPNFGQRAPTAANVDVRQQQRSEELDRAGFLFRSLPGTALEAEAIKYLLTNERVRVFTGGAASEANLKQLRGPRILHVATHGFFLNDQQVRKTGGTSDVLPRTLLAENPLLRSGLVLAGANQRRAGFSDDGILTALEASRLDLSGTELVVLSACETGVGEVRNGDGITGLRRALLLAGAETQVTSLWRIADVPTKDLMVSFYSNLVAGAGRSAALRRAQLAMLRDPVRAHPYYWASFVAIGDWRPLSAQN